MSRLVLRSKEGTKLPEQKDRPKSSSSAPKTPPSKKDDSRKNRNNVNSKDSVQQVSCLEKEDLNGLEKEKNSQISIICSLPLSRLTGIIEKLNIKSPSQSNANVNAIGNLLKKLDNSGVSNNDTIDEDDRKDKDEEEMRRQSLDDDGNSNSKSQDQLLVKSLCLYCDKQFSTQKMQQKHIEKFHATLKDRRFSIRNSSQVQTSPTNNKSGGKQRERASASATPTANTAASKIFPGCLYCKKTRSLEMADSSVIDFNGLFLHLTDYHPDKYFGCKICVLRFQNIAKLLKHMQNVHNTLPDAQLKLTKDSATDTLEETYVESTTSPVVERHTRTKQRHIGQNQSSSNSMPVRDQESVIGAEEAILSRLGLTQNRRRNPSSRKGVQRLRRESSVPEILLKTDTIGSGISAISCIASSPSKSRSRGATVKCTNAIGDAADSVVFRIPARTDALATVFDESFYKEVTSNVRNNLLFYIDGKLEKRSHISSHEPNEANHEAKSLPMLLRSTLASNFAAINENFDCNLQDTEIHVATNIPATTAFPTLLTAEQYCVDVTLTKIRRPHTKHSWKWKWDSVKKYKLINEGGKMVKKAKQPLHGLRDLSKLDMWTQLSMRQKHEKQQFLTQNSTTNPEEYHSSTEKRRLNDQLNTILDRRVLPHIIMEQSEQAVIKLENEEFNFSPSYDRHRDERRDYFYTAGNIVGQTFAADEGGFLSLLHLLPRTEKRATERKLVLSGEWARPRCYLCMCCGNKFEKLKSLEEHKMFRHSNILSTHYEVVGRELLAGNILQHLFIPKRALSIYSNASFNDLRGGNSKALVSYRRVNNTSAEEESSDSIQSITNCYKTQQRSYNLKNSNLTTDDCDTDTKTTLEDTNTISPTHSLQSSSISTSITPTSSLSQNLQKAESKDRERKWKCSKCNRKCNSMADLYRHMLDCSGDYVWSMVKKRKYRYYCGSKKRRPLHKQHLSESRRTKQEKTNKNTSVENCTTEESSSNSYKPKTPPRPRPSDAESIKKMLENLPPKRICKKIFPTVNKAKKARKATFITKLYNTKVLRKTRARQISNAAKRATQSRFSGKSQIKNKALKTLRCKKHKISDTSSSKTEKPTTTVLSIGKLKSAQTENGKSTKKDINSEVSQQQQSSSKSQSIVVPESDLKNNETQAKKSQDTIDAAAAASSFDCKNIENNIDASELKKPPMETRRGSAKEVNEIHDKNDNVAPAEVVVVHNAQEMPKTQQTAENQACNKKRSKRISDCIAMLTGKLEEKLKTESTVNSKMDEAAAGTDTTKAPSTEKHLKKAPKRKAISRRIIQPDVNDNTSSELDQQSKNAAIPTTVPPIVTTTVTTSKRSSIAKEGGTTTTSTTSTSKATTTIAPKQSISLTKVTINAKPVPQPLPLSVPVPVPVPVPPPTVAIPIQPSAINVMPTTVTPSNVLPKLVLPNTVTPPASLVSIPIPMGQSLHTVSVPLNVLQSHLPMFLAPVQQNINATTLPSAQLPQMPMTIPINTNSKQPSILPSVALPLLPPPPLIQAHVPSTTLTTPVDASPQCNIEPLNLSNSRGPKKQTTAELRAQRPGMPTRRQTICGFENRDVIPYNDMEPLDLSKKSRESSAISTQVLSLQMPPPVPVPAPAPQSQTVQLTHIGTQISMPQIELLNNQVIHPQATAQAACSSTKRVQIDESSSKPINMVITPTPTPTVQSDNVVTTNFYSNLELLKIPPQVHPSSFYQVSGDPIKESQNSVSNGITTTNISTNSNLQKTAATKTNSKKRNNPKSNVEQVAGRASNCSVATTNKAKEHTSSNKKESAAKNPKPIMKMDDEVISHIDDAINSVINAVKDSLPENDEDEDKVPSHKSVTTVTVGDKVDPEIESKVMEPPPILTKEIIAPAVVSEIMLTPKKRTLRSKTLDCRSGIANRLTEPALQTEVFHASPAVLEQNNLQVLNENPAKDIPQVAISKHNEAKGKTEETTSTTKECEEKDNSLNTTPYIDQEALAAGISNEKKPEENKANMSEEKKETTTLEKTKETIKEKAKEDTSVAISIGPEKDQTDQTAVSTAIEKKQTNEQPTLKDSSNIHLIVEENMSNINNTSSGFHSSSTPDNAGGDVKKKQRKRRKNELAAIVADQLLESFKIDKARRDSLKKLENLAYEKSEDLLLTGMLLMSSTKRNAASGISFTQQNTTEKRAESTKRSKREDTIVVRTTQPPKTRGKSNENSMKNIQPKTPVTTIDEFDDIITPRKSKRRQSRRKTTKSLDNENLSKLKSSLESFSIGIEKQLSEIEARNANTFNNCDRKNSEQAPLLKQAAAAASILRPSILSATLLEQVDTHQKNISAADNNSKAAPTFSRDPRLNKNIHKDEQQTCALSAEKNRLQPAACDLEDDNYLTEIAKNVNEKIMSAENEDFAFADDCFEIGGNEFHDDDSNSKFSRPPTSMSVRSAPNFNDDRSNLDSMCDDENTNTEVMDMDLDDEMSVYTSFSQDIGRGGRGRKRRRRRSILLKRRPKKRRASQDLTAEKFECELCKKTFFAATSLSKHNMTLAHVSKVSEREYLMSKASNKTLASASDIDIDIDKITSIPPPKSNLSHSAAAVNVVLNQYENISPIEPLENIPMGAEGPININNFNETSHRLSLNPDERLFFECCNILKSADTSRIVRGDNENENQNSFLYQNLYKNQTTSCPLGGGKGKTNINDGNLNLLHEPMFKDKLEPTKTTRASKTQDSFRNPMCAPCNFNKLPSVAASANERQNHSPTYSQFSAVTNTTSRFKTKAAMKGYENGNIHATLPTEETNKSRATCKLTELADIALGHDDKPRTPEVAPNLDHLAIIGTAKRVVTPEYITMSVVDSRRNCNFNNTPDNKKKAAETQGSSSSSRTIMHSSIIKAAVEEHSKPQPVNKIIIPERPFKNIGLEEKESITFQKPKTTTMNLLLDDNSMSTASYSDRDDFDFGSLSCDDDDDTSDKILNEEKNIKSNSSDSSSSRATAKTFENKSLIMGRIFKNASTKPKAPVKSVGTGQKDHPPPKAADLDQLFDELRAEGMPKPKPIEPPLIRKDIKKSVEEEACKEDKIPPPPPPPPSGIIKTPEAKRKSKTISKPKPNKKSQKDYTKLQSELGMNQEEIERLIDDGQRKSKRRCAANRSKKLIEMWSSDEYEEFLSTKDIIALIEEKEKQEQRKKRKNNVIATNIVDAEKGGIPKTCSTVMNEIAAAATSARKHSRSHSKTEIKKNEEKQKTTGGVKTSSKQILKEKVKPPTTTLMINETMSSKAETWIKPPEDSTNTTSKGSKRLQKLKRTRQTSNKGHNEKKAITQIQVVAALNTEETPSETLATQISEQNLYLLDIKQNQNNNNNTSNTTRNNKTKKDKSSFKEDVNSYKSQQTREANKNMTDMKKRNYSGNNKKNKGKRKTQTEKSPSRKRQASDKLYYWSSSSDEDFGRINHNEPEFENTEQYQKHGWIVGDSHKKLVTLLAIAKGNNKKVESCGVKKNVSKRKS